jgi:SPP1 family predicted phage head-tail adaptor
MNAGKLNNRITIKRLTETSDEYGGTISTVADYKTFWANKKVVNSDVKTENGARALFTEVEFVVRAKAADLILEDDLIQVEGESSSYRINSIVEYDENNFSRIKATKID